MSASPFYEVQGEEFAPTELTRGPWDADAQHAGPPAALLGRAVERLGGGGAPMRVGRITYEILRPVPLAPLRVDAAIVRDGRRVRLAEATMRAGGSEVVRARAWLLREQEVGLPPGLERETPPDRPEDGVPSEFFPTGADVGYHTAVEYRFIRGAFLEAGPAQVWMRSLAPLVAGEELSPLQRVLVVADSGNGVSATLDWRRFIFINVDLTVHLERMPVGEWVCVDAVTRPTASGVGSAESQLSDRAGRIGRAVQTLLFAER